MKDSARKAIQAVTRPQSLDWIEGLSIWTYVGMGRKQNRGKSPDPKKLDSRGLLEKASFEKSISEPRHLR